jgi:site-specific recombinase XerD
MAIPGLFERAGAWWISYYDSEGKRHREKIGRRKQAIDAVARRRMEVKDGRFIPPKQGSRLTFRELAQAAMVQKKLRLAPLSYETDQMRLRKLMPLIGNVPVDGMTPDRIDETLAALRATVSSSTANRYRSLISSIFAFAIRSGRMTVNPVARVKRYKENDSRIRWLKPEEEKAIRKAFVADSHEAEFDLALNTGMRRGEQFGLEWKDCDIERGILTVKGKTGRRHIIANKKAIASLRSLQTVRGASEKYVSPDMSEGVARDWRRWFEDAVEEAGVEDFHWHDLRHTFASRLVMAGVDIRTVQSLMGHKSIVMTMKYAHLAADHRQAAVEKMNPEVKP